VPVVNRFRTSPGATCAVPGCEKKLAWRRFRAGVILLLKMSESAREAAVTRITPVGVHSQDVPMCDGGRLTLAVRLGAPQLVTRARQLVENFLMLQFTDLDVVSRCAMCTHELLENIIKYGAAGPASITVEVHRQDKEGVLLIRSDNAASAERRADIVKRLSELCLAVDPIAYYDRIIRESALRQDGSGLGLARIRAEGHFKLGYRLSGDRITISAEMGFGGEGSAAQGRGGDEP
jgi:hypothetical protein